MTHYTDNLSQLGAQTAAPASPETAVLERVLNPHADTLYLARFTAPEFTSLCPVTGQPDFAHIVIDYAPGDWLVRNDVGYAWFVPASQFERAYAPLPDS